MKKNFYFIIVLTFSVLFVQANTQSVIWSENFEGDWTANWYVENGTWEVGTPTSGPNSAYAGVKCAATVLGGNYPATANTRFIQISKFVVPSLSENPRLRFWHWYSFSYSDFAKVQIKVDGTNDWVDISTSYTWTGSNIWTCPLIDLSDYAGQSVQIAFYFSATNNTGISGDDVSTGWYIDDIEIVTGPISFNNPEDWENGIGDWASERGTWEVGTPSSGPGAAYKGEHCAATVLNGNYAATVESRLISPKFVVPSLSENPRLRFWHWYSFSYSDFAKVQIKVDGTNDWVDISTSYTWTGSNIWTCPLIDLSDYAGQSVQIAFYFSATNNTGISGDDVSTGWYIDDIEIVTGPISFNNPEDWENGIGDWASERGTWEVGTPSSGPGAAYKGEHCAATVLNGNYAATVESRLISPKFVVPSLSENPRLRFWHWYSFSYSDFAKVQIKVDGTNDWVDISTSYTWTGSNIWTCPLIDLSDYAGQSVQIAFYFSATNNTGISGDDVSTGWYIDDIEIVTGPISFNNPEDWENGIGDWASERGTWEVGTPSSGPGAAYKGEHCAATVLNGNYAATVESRLISPKFVVPSLSENPRLRFWHWYSFSYSDFAKVQIKVDGTNNWVDITLSNYINTSGNIWTYTYFSLLDYAGQSVQVAFYFSATNNTGISGEDVSTGWYIDDIKIESDSQFSKENDILSYEFGTPPQNGVATINPATHTIAIEVDYGTVLTNLVATFTLSDGATAKVGGVLQTSGATANNFTNPVTYTVSAEDGTTVQDWIVTVTVAPNTETEITDFGFGIPPQTGAATINPTAHTIDIEVEYGADLTGLVATFTLSGGATAKVEGVLQTSGTTGNNFTNPVTYTVTAEDGTTVQDWIVTVTVAPNTETDITDFGFGIPPQTGIATINPTTHTIAIEVEYGTVLTNLVATFTLSDGATAKVEGVLQTSGATANNFTNPVTYTVTAEDGITVQNWIVTVTVAPNSETDITDFGFGIPPQTGAATINPTAHTIGIEVEYGTVLTNLVSTFTLSDGATAKVGGVLQTSGATGNNFTNPVTYAVTAEDGTTVQVWIVTVTVAPNTETEITDFGFGIPPQTGIATINPATHTIAIEVEYGTVLTNLVATFTLSDGATAKVGGVLQTSGANGNNFTNPVTYAVTAEDGTTVQVWIVTVTVAPNTETEITDFGFGIPPQTGIATINPATHTIAIEVEYGTVLTNLVATFTLSDGATAKVGGVLQTSGATGNNFTNPVTYAVTAEDGTTVQNWVVTVTVAPFINNEAEIISYSFGIPPQTGNASINATNKTIAIEVGYGTVLTNLVATFTLSDGATAKVGGVLQTSGATGNNFTNPVTYAVTAEDGTTVQVWVVTVTVAPFINNEAEIISYSFGIPPQTGNASINPTAHTIGIEVEYGTVLTNLVSTFTLSDGATAKVGGVLQTSGATGNNFTNPVTYAVTAEDGTTVQVWIVTVTVAPNTETEITDFGFGIPPQTGIATINPATHTIAIEVEYGTVLTNLVATFTLSDGATAKVGGVLQTSGATGNNFTNPVTYAVTAEDGTTVQVWIVTVTVAPNTETEITDFGFGIPPQTGIATINPATHTIAIEVEYGTVLTNLVATFTLSDGATAKVGGVLQTSGATGNNFTNPVTYAVTAEDGTTVQNWVVTVTVAPFINNEAEIISYSFGIPPQTGNASINATNKTIAIEVGYGTVLTNLVATFTLSDGATAKVGGVLQTSGATGNNFTNPVTYAVTAEDGTTVQVWVVTVTVAPFINNEAEIISYSFGIPPQTGNASINATNKTIAIEVGYGTVLTNLVATFTLSDGATAKVGEVLQTSGATGNNFTNPVTYAVTAEDGTTVQVWIVTVTVAPNTETEITDFGFGIPPQTGIATINPATHTIAIEVEYGTVLTNLVATFTLSDGATAKVGGVLQTSGATGNNFTNPVTYAVTAEDGTTVQNWVVTVTVAPFINNEAEIISYSFGIPPQTGNSSINATNKTIAIEVEYGTVLTNLVATFTLSDGATAKVGEVLQTSGATGNNFTNPVTYAVTAEDGTTVQVWVVTVTVAPFINNEAEIISYSFGIPPQTGNASINATNKTIAIEVEYGTVLTNLVSTFTLSDGATAKVGEVLQTSGATANNFTNPVTYAVTAEDGTTVQNWIVTVTVAPNTETEITDFGFGIPPQSGAATINPIAHTIDIKVEYGTVLTNLVATFTLSDGAKAKVGGVMQTSGATGNNFTNPVTYVVTAEDGVTVQEWNIIVELTTGTNEISLRNFKIYPNPFTEVATIEFSNPKHSNHQLILYNILGEKVLEMGSVTSDKIILSRGTLKTGIYLVELRGENVYEPQLIILKE
jgi:hypothetical protein